MTDPTETTELDKLLAKATKADLEALARKWSQGPMARLTCFDLRDIIGRRRLAAVEAEIEVNDRAWARAAQLRDPAKLRAIEAKTLRLNKKWKAELGFLFPDRGKGGGK